MVSGIARPCLVDERMVAASSGVAKLGTYSKRLSDWRQLYMLMYLSAMTWLVSLTHGAFREVRRLGGHSTRVLELPRIFNLLLVKRTQIIGPCGAIFFRAVIHYWRRTPNTRCLRFLLAYRFELC